MRSKQFQIKPIKKFECKNHDFITSSEVGLKQHTSKTNTKIEDQGKKIGWVKFYFKSNSNETLDVHIGTHHADIVKCGLCEKSFETR